MTLLSHLFHQVENINLFILFHLLETVVNSNEGARPTNSSTNNSFYQKKVHTPCNDRRIPAMDNHWTRSCQTVVIDPNTLQKIQKRCGICWNTMIGPASKMKLSYSSRIQADFIRMLYKIIQECRVCSSLKLYN